MSKDRSARVCFKNISRQSGLLDSGAVALSTGFGVGCLPGAPGTFGILLAVPAVWAMDLLWVPLRILVGVAVLLLALWASDRTEALLGKTDPSEIVIDEVVGFCLTMAFVPLSWTSLSIGFVSFRLFDILKPFPISLVERRVKGGAGIVADDLLAGVYAFLTTCGILFFTG
jgi:phosphatidylglycerophosphatase A